MKRIRITSPSQPRVRHIGPTETKVDPAVVAAALEAEASGAVATGTAPPAFVALRQEIATRLTSTGGRPRLEGAVRRQKIPLSEADWERLLELSDRIATGDVRPSPGQVASALLHSSLANLDFAAARLRSAEALLGQEPQSESPTGERLFGVVAQFKPFAVPDTTEPISVEASEQAYREWAESLDEEPEQVAS